MNLADVRKLAARAKRDNLAETMALQLRGRGLAGGMVREHEFARAIGRKWRFDFAYPLRLIALEVEGGTWVGGAHNRGAHFESDCEKYAIAAIHGWRVIRATTDQVRNGVAGAWMQRILTEA